MFYGKIENKYPWDIFEIIHDREKLKGKELVLFHPCPKPINLLKRLITPQCNQKDIILDLFGGSGTTLIACEQTGRRCFMMEIDPRYCQVIVDRWQSYTGKKAVLVKNG